MRVRIVLDTNVVLSALLWRGAPHHLLAAIGRQQRIQIYSSTALLEELADVPTRPSASKRLVLIGKTASEVLSDYVDIIELVEPTSVPLVAAADIDDDQVIAAAVMARADPIASGDRKHLLPLGSHQGIPIVDPAEALRRIADG